MTDAVWPPMVWIGGAQGAGKSTIGWLFSRYFDLPLHSVDMWGYDHMERLPPANMTLDEQLAAGPEVAVEAFVAASQARLPLLIADVAARATAPVPVVVEGPQLMPSMAAPLLPGCAVFLLPTPERTRAVRVVRPDADPARLDRLVARDALIAERVRVEATALGRPVVDVSTTPDWSAVYDAVRDVLAPVVDHILTPGAELAGQRAYENDVAARQGRLWAAATGQDVIPGSDVPPFRWACECGKSRCVDRSPLGTPPLRAAR